MTEYLIGALLESMEYKPCLPIPCFAKMKLLPT